MKKDKNMTDQEKKDQIIEALRQRSLGEDDLAVWRKVIDIFPEQVLNLFSGSFKNCSLEDAKAISGLMREAFIIEEDKSLGEKERQAALDKVLERIKRYFIIRIRKYHKAEGEKILNQWKSLISKNQIPLQS
jgi:hypothetical protein